MVGPGPGGRGRAFIYNESLPKIRERRGELILSHPHGAPSAPAGSKKAPDPSGGGTSLGGGQARAGRCSEGHQCPVGPGRAGATEATAGCFGGVFWRNDRKAPKLTPKAMARAPARWDHVRSGTPGGDGPVRDIIDQIPDPPHPAQRGGPEQVGIWVTLQ